MKRAKNYASLWIQRKYLLDSLILCMYLTKIVAVPPLEPITSPATYSHPGLKEAHSL